MGTDFNPNLIKMDPAPVMIRENDLIPDRGSAGDLPAKYRFAPILKYFVTLHPHSGNMDLLVIVTIFRSTRNN